MPRAISALALKAGDIILYTNPRFNERVVEVVSGRDGAIKVHTRFADSFGPGEPATSFYYPGDMVTVP